MSEPTNDPPDAFEEFARATGLGDLADLDEAALYQSDDAITATDGDGDTFSAAYLERTDEDGEVLGLVLIHTEGPTGHALFGPGGMEELARWLLERAERARVLEEEQK